MSVTTAGGDTVNVLATGVPTSLSTGDGSETVNVGNAGSVQGIRGALTIRNPEDFTTVNVNDSADTTARTVVLSTFVSGGANWGAITGLAPAAVHYVYGDTRNVNVTTGLGNDTINVLATGVNVLPPGLTTSLNSGGGRDTINVGNAGSVQGILGVLAIQNTPGANTINVNDSADATARSATLGLFASGGVLWGSITGLAPAAINYRYADTSVLNVTTGSGSDVVNVSAVGSPTNLSTSGGNDTVNVGGAGNVGNVFAPLTIQNAHGLDTIVVNDSADTAARTATLSTFVSGGANWGAITGLAPAAIDYKYASTGAVNITTGSGGDVVNVLTTGVPTGLSTSGGVDTVNVGNAGSVQGILGALTVRNPPSFDTLNINDSADTTARTVVLNSSGSVGTNGATITGLAPAAINYTYTDISSLNVIAGLGNDTINVLATGIFGANVGTSGGNDTVNVGNAGSVQNISGVLTIRNAHGSDTINVNDSADTMGRTATLSTFVSGGANWGLITGLASGDIEYRYAGTRAVNITTGPLADTVNVLATGVPTNLSTSGGLDTINVGSGGSVQGLLGALTIQDPAGSDTINIDDDFDSVARNVTLSTFASGGASWGAIAGLAPAAIRYKYADTSDREHHDRLER